MPYTFRLPLRSLYGPSNLDILVISTCTTLTNILMESQISSTLLLKYLINSPLPYKIIFPKYHLDLGPLVLPNNQIKVY